MGRKIFHLALGSDWDAAVLAGDYRVSTLGRSLDDVGFVHASATPEQVTTVASTFYASVTEPLVLLTIEVGALGCEVRDEQVGDQPVPFPHVYGPVPVAAVVAVTPVERRDDGGIVWPGGPVGTLPPMSDDTDVVSVERVIAAPAGEIFALLADPARHHDIDGSGTVRDARGGSQQLALGSTFGMSMKMGVPYSMVSTVIEFEPDRRIAWQTRGPTKLGSWAGGRIWRYELEPVDGGTLVRESWDIRQESAITKPLVRMGGGKTRGNMEQTLARIEQITTR